MIIGEKTKQQSTVGYRIFCILFEYLIYLKKIINKLKRK